MRTDREFWLFDISYWKFMNQAIMGTFPSKKSNLTLCEPAPWANFLKIFGYIKNSAL